jgi:tRNA (guanosine-2'-O-)-methyltransferase
MDAHLKHELISYLSKHVTEHKLKTMYDILQYRTRHVTVVLEDIFQSHNASAILRSTECFGVQDMHIIADKFNFSVTAGIAMGSSKWVDMHRYKDVQTAFQTLKRQGYRMVATTPNTDMYLEDLPLNHKMALIFGTENIGLSEYAMKHADDFIKIPMFGFTQSFNVSVSVALCLYHIISKLHASASIPWKLDEAEKLEVMLTWLRRSIRGYQEYENMFFQEKKLL